MKRILIADPDYSSRSALSLLLTKKLGIYNICEAGDAETLIRMLAEAPPDILLLDWRMYGAPAPETCSLLLKAYPGLKIILLSINSEDCQTARGVGAGFIHKGSAPGEVLVALEPLLASSE